MLFALLVISLFSIRSSEAALCKSQASAFCKTVDLVIFCTPRKMKWQTIKFLCGEECNLCGQAAPNCEDIGTKCASEKAEYCDGGKWNPMLAEYICAKTCGYCTTPTA